MSLAHSHTGWRQQTGLQAFVGPTPHACGPISAPTYHSLHLRSQKMARKTPNTSAHVRSEVLAGLGVSLTLSVSRGREAILLGPTGTLVVTMLLEPLG